MSGVVVTGAAGDMGAGVCAAFRAQGRRVYAADLRPIDASDGRIPVELDVTHRDAVFGLAQRALNEGGLTLWVNAAGIVAPARVISADPEAWDRIIAVNLTGTFHGCAAALEAMARGGQGGAIVNVGSLSGQLGGTGMHPAYGASKAGVHNLTKSYALEGAKHGVRCNAVAPSVIDGSMAAQLSDNQRAQLAAHNPMRRLGRMSEVVLSIAFLADPERAGYINGVTLPINGGSYV